MRADSEAATAMAMIGVALEEMIKSEEVGEEVEVTDMAGEVMMASEEVAMVALEGEDLVEVAGMEVDMEVNEVLLKRNL